MYSEPTVHCGNSFSTNHYWKKITKFYGYIQYGNSYQMANSYNTDLTIHIHDKACILYANSYAINSDKITYSG